MTTATTTISSADVQEMIDTRRDLHAHPELAFEELRTSALVAERLKKLGLTAKSGIGRTGVVATITGQRPGKTVLLRADMDALPIQEENEVPYRSQTAGKMHACGHDCHTSILLGVAKQLIGQTASLPGAVKLCFQPAEENGGGANAMIADGVLEGPKPDAAFGLHVWQDLDLGKVGVTPGPFMAAVDEFTVTVSGKGAHGAMPHYGIDPVLCLANIVTALQTIASRETDPFQEVVVSVTRLQAGTAFNIIPESAWMNGTARSFDPQVWRALPERFERIVAGAAAAYGCRATIDYHRHNQPTVNDPAMAASARGGNRGWGRRTCGRTCARWSGEDFSAFLAKVPGCFIAVGSRNASRGLTHEHHHPRFDVDEASLEIGAEILLRTARKFLGALAGMRQGAFGLLVVAILVLVSQHPRAPTGCSPTTRTAGPAHAAPRGAGHRRPSQQPRQARLGRHRAAAPRALQRREAVLSPRARAGARRRRRRGRSSARWRCSRIARPKPSLLSQASPSDALVIADLYAAPEDRTLAGRRRSHAPAVGQEGRHEMLAKLVEEDPYEVAGRRK